MKNCLILLTSNFKVIQKWNIEKKERKTIKTMDHLDQIPLKSHLVNFGQLCVAQNFLHSDRWFEKTAPLLGKNREGIFQLETDTFERVRNV